MTERAIPFDYGKQRDQILGHPLTWTEYTHPDFAFHPEEFKLVVDGEDKYDISFAEYALLLKLCDTPGVALSARDLSQAIFYNAPIPGSYEQIVQRHIEGLQETIRNGRKLKSPIVKSKEGYTLLDRRAPVHANIDLVSQKV